ncbi:glucose 1-dehydrogenase [Paenibacillus cellulosilyticus]|uniref:Glucose 1-dehydrogenase n=1 Tax=Paenibacillus cellulosilyticus TaxID=375489 RepID=A0A2V2YU06_9BACL|nr:SDR family oxidoreductase [Paenibacillus cellulosilyticus]PWV99333.1 glucose 1-dehydrogenase [Paenibacillus cellulosilyticus]QKS45098.1 SDR family oxidoreductase [Paenibacillus cellulosilyticus]
MSDSLIGKSALVTGAGTGIGKGIAIELASRGVKVAIHYNSSDAGARDTQQRIEELGGQCMIVQADVADQGQIIRMVETAADELGGIDILVNNAALQLNIQWFEYTEEQYDRVMNINLKGYWQCTQAVIPYMKQRNFGRIINISSVHGKRPTDFDAVYCMSKGGIKMLGRESALELARYGITVNTIAPGAIDVGKFKASHREPNRKKFPLGRVGLPADVAALACYIASDETSFMTGATIRLDGAGMLI